MRCASRSRRNWSGSRGALCITCPARSQPRPRSYERDRRVAYGVPLRRGSDVARPAGCQGEQGRPASREDADAADGDRSLVPQAPDDEAGARPQDLPYLLRGLEITRPNQVWAMDITYIPMA